MHEMSLAEALVEQVETIAQRENAARVSCVTVNIGALAGVDRDAFEFAFPYAVEGSRLEGAALRVHESAADVACGACGKRSSPDILYMRCMHCGASDVKVVAGREFLIESVELE